MNAKFAVEEWDQVVGKMSLQYGLHLEQENNIQNYPVFYLFTFDL